MILDSLSSLPQFRFRDVCHLARSERKLWPYRTSRLASIKRFRGYQSLSEGKFYQAIQLDLLAGTLDESDTIYATMNTIFHPVNSVISNHSYGRKLISSSEASHYAQLTLPTGEMGEHLSRVDRSWLFLNGQSWTRFAVKRPGALDPLEWNAAAARGTAEKGGKVCKQLKKYAHAYDTPFLGCCDGKTLVVPGLEGTGMNGIIIFPWQHLRHLVI